MSPSWLLIILACCGFATVLMIVTRAVAGRQQCRRRRLDVLEEALRRPDMDSELRREVVNALKSGQTGGFSCRHLWFSAGWLGMFAGGGLAIFGNIHQSDVGLMILVASLAVVTLPLALRELDSRRVPDRESS